MNEALRKVGQVVLKIMAEAKMQEYDMQPEEVRAIMREEGCNAQKASALLKAREVKDAQR